MASWHTDLVKMIYLLVVMLLVTYTNGLPIEDFFSFNSDIVCSHGLYENGRLDIIENRTQCTKLDCSEYRFDPGDDFSSQSITIPTAFPFHTRNFTNVFVSTM